MQSDFLTSRLMSKQKKNILYLIFMQKLYQSSIYRDKQVHRFQLVTKRFIFSMTIYSFWKLLI